MATGCVNELYTKNIEPCSWFRGGPNPEFLPKEGLGARLRLGLKPAPRWDPKENGQFSSYRVLDKLATSGVLLQRDPNLLFSFVDLSPKHPSAKRFLFGMTLRVFRTLID